MVSEQTSDNDAILPTIQDAVNCTLPGGIVHILHSGVFRESVEVCDSMVIHGASTGEVVIFGGDVGGSTICSGFGGITRGIQVTEGAEDTVEVTLRNLTIQGMSDAGVLLVGDPEVNLHEVRIVENAAGLVMTGSGGDKPKAHLEGCEVSGNVLNGIEAADGEVLLTDTTVSHNGLDGVKVLANVGSVLNLAVTGSRIDDNGGDGLDFTGTVGSPIQGWVQFAMHDTHVSKNGGWGLNLTGNVVFTCNPGYNALIRNASGGDSSATCGTGTNTIF